MSTWSHRRGAIPTAYRERMDLPSTVSPAPPAESCITYRVAVTEEDLSAVLVGDVSSDTVFEVSASADGFAIRAVPRDPPVRKTFPTDEAGDDDGAEHRVVALDGEHVCGYVDTEYEHWNRRLVIADIEVAAGYRRLGIGRALLRHAIDRARELGASHVWLEVTNLNAPAIHAYRSMGFTLCGLDMSLYQGTESDGEIALFFCLTLD